MLAITIHKMETAEVAGPYSRDLVRKIAQKFGYEGLALGSRRWVWFHFAQESCSRALE